jgi:hypothetical protein
VSATADTRPIPVQAQRRRRHPLRSALIVLVVLLALVAAALVVGDRMFRTAAERQVERSVETSLPKGVTGTVHARIDGFSALQQWLRGRFDDVTLTSDDLRIDGGAGSARVRVHGLPVSGKGAVRSASGTLTVSQSAITKLAPLAAADATPPKLGSGSVATSIHRTVLGVPISVDVTLKPSVRGRYVQLDPTKAQLRSGSLTVPGTALIHTLLPDGISVCVAKYLPPGVALTGLSVRTGSATVAFRSGRLDLGALQRGETGSC